MDAAVIPPLRIQVTRSEALPPSAARTRLHDFLVDYENRRRTSSNGGDSTISAQLQKLTDALHEEHNVRKIVVDRM